MRMRLGDHCAMRMVMMPMATILAAHLELRRADARAIHSFGPDRVAIDRQGAERRADLFERHARVDQRADDHVAGGTREAVEVQDLHDLSILHSATRQPAGFHHRVVVLLRENDVIEHLDAHDLAGSDQAIGQTQIVVARRRITGRVVVKQHDG